MLIQQVHSQGFLPVLDTTPHNSHYGKRTPMQVGDMSQNAVSEPRAEALKRYTVVGPFVAITWEIIVRSPYQ
jgi:hypothetical protein